MKKRVLRLVAFSVLLMVTNLAVHSQTTGSITGTVVDSNGAAVPNAKVVISGEGGREFTVVTNEGGSYRVPAVGAGLYTITISASGFKRAIVSDVKVDTGIPSTVNSTLQAGDISETITVTGGGEVLQTQTATVGTSITGRQITETPIASRDALDLVLNLPGTATVGRPRTSSVNGLPKGSLSITIDGVDVQDSLLRSSDGFFTYVRPRVDAIEEVTVSTANPGAESSGEGAVQIKFVTRRGTNDYKGGLFWQHRNTDLNAGYWFNNRDLARDASGKAPRTRIILNQYGGNFSGPIPFLRFGDSGGSTFDSGKNNRFFFVNYEEFRIPDSVLRTRVVLTPQAQAGTYSYIAGGVTQTANLFTIATANGQLATPDPTVAATLADIRAATATTGTFTPITNSPNIQNYNFQPSGLGIRKFLALRFDFNLTKNHSFENVTNWNDFVPSKDFLNGVEERFPGFPSYGQGSIRYSNASAVRSTFGTNVVNEARYTFSGGLTDFFPELAVGDFASQNGRLLNIAQAFGITNARATIGNESRVSPTFDFTDSVTWIKGSHSISFGGQYKRIKLRRTVIGRIVPTVGFGLDSSTGSADLPAFNMFNATTLPGASAAQLTEARNLYATLVGRVATYTTTAFLTEANQYEENAPQLRRIKQDTYGLFVQDTWRARPNFTINFGVRWQPQAAFIVNSENFARLENFEQVYGISGFGNLYKPGTLTGSTPRVVAAQIGEKAYDDDMNNFAPTVGVVWSPSFGDSGFMKSLFGASGKSVFRGGYGISFVREGTNLLLSILGANPGGSIAASRSIANGTLTAGTNLRDLNNPNLTPLPFPTSPSYPRTLTVADSTNAFDPKVKTGTVHSFSFGYQREVDRNTVVEFRYVGNRGIDLQRQSNLNELNTIENGFAAEFRLAQANLYANIAAGRGATFRYAGAGTGTSPLPLILAYINPAATYTPGNSAVYTSALFSNTTLVQQLSVNAPAVIGFAANIENNGDPASVIPAVGGRRLNAITNGLPRNFFYVNPTTPTGGSFIIDNNLKTWYDSGIIEVRRRMSQGLRLQGSYVWSKAMTDGFSSSSVVFADYTRRENGLELARNVQAFDITHQFKMDATYDLPFGRGRSFLSDSNGFVDAFLGGWTVLPTLRWQSGSPISFGNVQLIGITARELQKEIKVRKGPGVVTWLPDDIILNSQRAFNISVTGAGGYGTTFGGAPSGRYIAPAGIGNCISRYVGECGFNNLILYGPSFFKFDVSLGKKFKIGESRSIEFRATALDALNMPNFRVGGWAADTVGAGCCTATFGQLGNGTAYQDTSTTNDPGGRLIDLMLRINF